MDRRFFHLTDRYLTYYTKNNDTIVVDTRAARYPVILDSLLSADYSEEKFLAVVRGKAESEVDNKHTQVANVLQTEDNVSYFNMTDGTRYILQRSVAELFASYTNNPRGQQALSNFWERCKRNPSMRSIDNLMNFINAHKLTLMDDGCFVAYKGVSSDYLDIHSNTFDNHPGRVVKVPRESVDHDDSVGCSYGLHVGAYSYASSFGPICVSVKVDPKDVVAVPLDCGVSKMRVCEYYVLDNCFEQFDHTRPVAAQGISARRDLSKAARSRWTEAEERLLAAYCEDKMLDVSNAKRLAEVLCRSVESVTRKFRHMRASKKL